MNILKKLFGPKERPVIEVDFKSFESMLKENINIPARARARGMFAVTLNKNGSRTRHLVEGINERKLKGKESGSLLASLLMVHNNGPHSEPAIVQLHSDGTVLALDANNQPVSLESINFSPAHTTCVNSIGVSKERAPSSIEKNYTVKPEGFTVEDAVTGDGLVAVIRDGMFHGAVLMKGLGATSELAPWPLDSNPFEDETNFCGSGMSPHGQWSFSITPSAPFSRILHEAREAFSCS